MKEIEIEACTDIEDATEELANAVQKFNEPMQMWFNEVKIIAYPGATKDAIYSAWWKERRSRESAEWNCPAAKRFEAAAKAAREAAVRAVAKDVVVKP